MGYVFKLTFALLVAAAMTCGQALAFTQLYRFQYCSSILNPAERLVCYDNYALELGLPPPDSGSHVSASQHREGSWTVRTEAFSPDHPATTFAFTEGKVISQSTLSDLTMPTLIARCFDSKTELYMGFGSALPSKAGPTAHSVLYALNPKEEPRKETKLLGGDKAEKAKVKRVKGSMTFGERKPVDVMMNVTPDGRALFFPNPVSYIRQMRLSSVMLFTYTRKDAPPMEILFPLEGLASAIANVRDSCGW